jgi:hypothetical protein
MIEFYKTNINPKNKRTGDCVIRALAGASGKDYKKVAQELFELWMKTGYVFNDKHTYEKWLEQNGFVKMKQPRKLDNTKYLVGEIDELIGSGNVAVISLASHLTYVEDDAVFDLWDCRKKTIGNYYIKECD